MRAFLSALVTIGLASAAQAQTPPPQGYELMPGRITSNNNGVTLVTRLNTGTPTAPVFPPFEALQMYDSRFVQGLGDLRNTSRGMNPASECEVNTVRIAYQDENTATSEGFKIVCRAEVAGRSSAATTIWTQDVVGFPAQSPGGASGLVLDVVIMDQNSTPAVNSAIPIPCRDGFFFGMEIPALPTGAVWPGTTATPGDGLSIPASYYDTVAGYSVFDWPKGGNNADYLYDIRYSLGRGRFASKMLFSYSLIPDTPVLQMGALHQSGTSRHGADENYGAASYWPEADATTARGQLSHDGVVMRITDNNVTATSAGIYGAFVGINSAKDLGLPYITIPGLSGSLYLGLPIYPMIFGALTNQDTEVVLAAPQTLPASVLGSKGYFQAYTSVGGQDGITNLAVIDFLQ